MKSTVLLTLALLAVAAVARAPKQAPHQIFLKDQEMKEDTTTFYYLQGLRGFWLGFEHGFLKTKDDTQTCLDDKTSQKLLKIIDAVVGLQINKLQSLIPDMMTTIHSLSSCNVGDFKKVADYCVEDFSRCAPNKIMANVQKNMFVVMGKFTDLSTLVKQFPADDST